MLLCWHHTRLTIIFSRSSKYSENKYSFIWSLGVIVVFYFADSLTSTCCQALHWWAFCSKLFIFVVVVFSPCNMGHPTHTPHFFCYTSLGFLFQHCDYHLYFSKSFISLITRTLPSGDPKLWFFPPPLFLINPACLAISAFFFTKCSLTNICSFELMSLFK